MNTTQKCPQKKTIELFSNATVLFETVQRASVFRAAELHNKDNNNKQENA